MMRDYSANEVKALIEEHSGMLRTLGNIASMPQGVREEVRNAAGTLISSNAMREILSGDLDSGNREYFRYPEAVRLASALFLFRRSARVSAAAKELLDASQGRIQASLQQLQPARNSVSWFFADSRSKEQASSACEYLRTLSAGSYGRDVRDMAAAVSQVQKVPVNTVLSDIAADPDVYLDLLERLYPRTERRAPVALPIALVLRRLDDLSRGAAGCDEAIEEDKRRVVAAAMRLVASETMKILGDVPVEQLNKERSGIRVKTLRDSGYATMADIYAASEYQLEAINGISADGAKEIKGAAKDFAERAMVNARIRISSDDRTEDASRLVSAVYFYRIQAGKLDELHALVLEKQEAVESAKKELYSVWDGLAWLFFTEEQRERVRGAYRFLTELLDGEYASRAGQIIGSFGGRMPVSTEEAWQDFERDNVVYYTILEELVPDVLGNGDGLYGLPEDLAREIREEALFPDGLLCTLRRYQEWGVKYILHQEKVLLGDEMGLGKTVQAIAAMVSLRNTGATHFLVVCPASVLSNWCREVVRHSRLSVTKVHGPGRDGAFESWQRTGGVAVTTYETTAFLQLEEDYRFDMLVVDEAHYIKNPEAKRTINVKGLCTHTDRILFMTGTALENRVDEMLSLITILQPETAAAVRNMTFMSTAPQFREKIAPVYYRRRREDVLTELPELIESKEWSTLSEEEEQVYEQTVLTKNYMAIRRVSWNVGDLSKSCKAARMLELIEEAAGEERKILVFSFFLDTIRDIADLLGDRCYGPINGSVPPQRRQEIIDEFEQAPAGSVLVAQIQSGGTGVNIQSASVVVICEPQFKPSTENQAISRAYRMGQARNVLVYRLLCENTVDEHITDILEQKQAVFDAFADKSAAAEQSGEMEEAAAGAPEPAEVDEKTFSRIIQEEIDRINAKNGTAGGEAVPDSGAVTAESGIIPVEEQ